MQIKILYLKFSRRYTKNTVTLLYCVFIACPALVPQNLTTHAVESNMFVVISFTIHQK